MVVRPDGKTWVEMFGNGTISVTPAINDAPEPIPYLRWQDDRIGLQTAETTKYLRLEPTDTVLGSDDCSCYVLRDDLTISDRLTVSGTVDLILKDGWTLTAKKGIYVGEGSTLNIYGQTGGGEIVARSGEAYIPEVAPGIIKEGFALTNPLYLTVFAGASEEAAEAQKYFKYQTDNLANANIGQYQDKLPQMPSRTDQRTVSGDAELFYGTSCVLGENMNMKLYFRLRDTTATSLKLTYEDYHGEEHEILVDPAELTDTGDGFVTYTLETLVAGDIDTTVTAILETADGRKVEAEDSISGYLERVKVSNPECKDIAEKMFQFGFLAKAYFLDLDDPLAPADDKTPVD